MDSTEKPVSKIINPTLQNVACVAGVVALALADKISGMNALIAIGVVSGFITAPSLLDRIGPRGTGASLAGTVGVLGASAQFLTRHLHMIPFVALAASMLLHGCGADVLPTVRNALNRESEDFDRLGAAVQALCPPSDATEACRAVKDRFNEVAATHEFVQSQIDSVTHQ